jgi:hypothetical protein
MTDLDKFAGHHAEVLRASVADAERPELLTLRRSGGARRGLLVAAIAAVVAVVVIAPMAWQRGQTSPGDTATTIAATTSEAVTTSTTTSAPPTSGATTLTEFDSRRFAAAMLDGAFGSDEDRIGMVVLVPATTDLTDMLSGLPELVDYSYLPPEVIAEISIGYADRRRMEPLQGSWQAYGLIPEYSGTPVWDWEPALGAIPDAVFAANLDFENPEIRVPDGWSVLAEMDSVVPSGSINAVTDSGLALINSSGTTIIGPDGSIREGEAAPVAIPDSCCGDANAYSYGDGVLLLYRGEGAWLLDLATVSWREIDPLPSAAYPMGTAIYPLGMAQLGDQLYVVVRAPRTTNTTSEVAALDLETGTWRVIDAVPSPITIGGVTTDGTRLLVAGTHQDNNNRVIGGRNPSVHSYTEADGWSELPTIPIDGQASTITQIDNVGLLAWNYDLESALLDEGGIWSSSGDVAMDSGECLPASVAIGSGAAGVCGGLAWFDGESATWSAINAPRNGHPILTDAYAYSIVTAAGKTTVLQYPLPPLN